MGAIATTPYRVEAFNTALASENKIHDDEVARRFGFTGGLVPGVEVYAYMTHVPVERWGRAWLERGSATCRLLKPVYDGDAVSVSAAEEGGGLAVTVKSRGEVCATGQMSLADAPSAPPRLDDFVAVAQRAERPPADPQSLAEGTWLGMEPFPLTPDYAAQYLSDVRESDPLYGRENLGHPGIVLRLGNWVLRQNVVLGPWMHVGSTVQNFAAAKVGDDLTARARVTANYEKKGHLFVELDMLAVANNRTPIARITHTAIYRPRQVAEAA